MIARIIKTYGLDFAILLYRKEGVQIENQRVTNIEAVIDFIENHLDQKLELETIAEAVHYSKYHLHRMFSDTVGITVREYVGRRQLTEGAKLLVFSKRSIIEIAFICGYEGQQAFTTAFKTMYKIPPAEYRQRQEFYPLQLRFTLNRKKFRREFSKSNVRLAKPSDIPLWMDLVRLVIDGYPCLDEGDYLQKLNGCIEEKRALIMEDGDTAIGIMAFSYDTGSIEFMGVHPQYRNLGIQKVFLDKLMEDYIIGREISTTTYRLNDKADTGYRSELKQLGFAEQELLVEFGYPTQRFILPPKIGG